MRIPSKTTDRVMSHSPLPSFLSLRVYIHWIDLTLFRIEEGAYYEAHQQLRVVASRYVKSQNWDAAVDILYEGSLSLLKAGQGGSGGDLGCYLVDVFEKAEKSVDAENKGKLLSILRTFPPEEPTRKKFVDEMLAWTIKFGEYPNGEPELHHVAGTLYAEGRTLFIRLHMLTLWDIVVSTDAKYHNRSSTL